MKLELPGIQQLFCDDCVRRTERACQVLSAGKQGLAANDYDRLYQEFDTLYGGARAVYFPQLERFFFALASYVRFLKRRPPDHVREEDVALIPMGIRLARQCINEELVCIGKDAEQLSWFVEQLNHRMKKLRGGK